MVLGTGRGRSSCAPRLFYFAAVAAGFKAGLADDAMITAGGPYRRKRSMFQAGAFGASPVCGMRMNFAFVSLSVMLVVSDSPVPSETAAAGTRVF